MLCSQAIFLQEFILKPLFDFQATVTINLLVRAASDLETHVVSVERVQEYTEVTTEVRE